TLASPSTSPLFPYTTLFRSHTLAGAFPARGRSASHRHLVGPPRCHSPAQLSERAMNNHPNAHLGHAEDASRFSNRAVLEIAQIDRLPRFGVEPFDHLEQQPTLIALLDLFHWIEGVKTRDRQPRAARLVPMVVRGKVGDGPVKPAAELGFRRGRIRRGPYPGERLLHDF